MTGDKKLIHTDAGLEVWGYKDDDDREMVQVHITDHYGEASSLLPLPRAFAFFLEVAHRLTRDVIRGLN